MDKVIKNFQNISYGPAPEDSKEVNSWIKNLKNPNNHFINGKFVKSSSSKKLNVIDGSIHSKEREIPEYIQLDGKSKSVKLIRVPKFSEVPYPVIMEPSLVIEYYSR